MKNERRTFYWRDQATNKRFETVAATRLSAAKKAVKKIGHRDIVLLLEGTP